MRKEKGGRRGKKKMEERQEEREEEGVELEERTEEMTKERTEEGTEGRIEDTEEGLQVTEEACEEDERCEKKSECHSAAKRSRVCATFTNSQEHAIVEFVKEHPELYDKEHGHFHDRQRKDALWAEISAELKLQPFDVRRWFKSQRTCYGKFSKQQSGQVPTEMTKRQSWVYQQMGFLKTHIRCKGPTEALGSRPIPTPAGIKNLMDLLLIQNMLSPVSRGRVEVNQYLHLHQFLQIPRYSNILTR